MDSMEIDDTSVPLPKEFNQLYAILKFFSEPVRYDSKMQDNISYEIFINICYHLPPKDLLMLACVCKHFKNMLDGNILSISWDIWKTSRERFTPFKDMDPPKGLSEQKFSRLLNFENGCEFCKSKDKRIQIYWVACVRSCKECLQKRAKRRQELEVEWKIESEVFTGTPHIVPCPDDDGQTQYYWVPHITSSQSNFLGVNILKRGEWTVKKKQEIQNVIDESLDRYHWATRCWQEQLKEQKDHLQNVIRKFCDRYTSYTPETLSKYTIVSEMLSKIEINPFVQKNWSIFQLNLIEALNSRPLPSNLMNDTFNSSLQPSKIPKRSEPVNIRPDRHYSENLPRKELYGPPRQKLKHNSSPKLPHDSNPNSMQIIRSIPNSTPLWENVMSHPTRNQSNQSNQLVRYNINNSTQDRVVLNRRNEIVKHLKLVALGVKQRNKRTAKTIPYTIGIHDVLFRYLPFCSSFINPPESPSKEYGGYYKKEYIYSTIIPQLQREAAVLSVSSGSRMENTQYHDILDVQGAINHHLDEHPVFKCRMCPDFNPSVIRKMKNHLREIHALLSEKDLSKLYVDPDAVINFLHFAFVPELNFLR
ncbi:hypothetical protein RhiirA1_409392 [Rhizophagus irregularis]|uniref:F-box domain-containing protein n=5 Tax=Rhizophagus irregularis TaxID=588596 RepID=A0A2I1EIX5_9GLOM|nr:hypothetical protein GLOIN_2v1541855 [Rhizophagus irregularis DAOM 181602=DAOM 197198]PKC74311.1 hypothetical protein RhiirA1_409392 [Rhizophagus irregularis]PKY22066.1 hypothetical protein RhiirB3_410153 [Rhizophagus irregularis]POG78081.1 hypothetical protein GLOIN_2v1541855 [Rhizophagus irregularis DAOM 181602=DAOM 197198]UZO12293.1 hypothetical protein OCT59_003837 [Rhizophagus irregularis]CAB4483080.1 unnamed protein product [Rhizophagus irregularis]|eukprot:XP_025184947.1 hypothetical protein GLOIN_2v1541855 [Rhizophagus irregularis DAOM 181602=DAOM 197198]